MHSFYIFIGNELSNRLAVRFYSPCTQPLERFSTIAVIYQCNIFMPKALRAFFLTVECGTNSYIFVGTRKYILGLSAATLLYSHSCQRCQGHCTMYSFLCHYTAETS